MQFGQLKAIPEKAQNAKDEKSAMLQMVENPAESRNTFFIVFKKKSYYSMLSSVTSTLLPFLDRMNQECFVSPSPYKSF